MHKQVRALFVTAVGVSSVTLVAAQAPVRQPPSDAFAHKPPNIVLIALDDIGFADLGAFGSEIRTPNIDSLAQNGLRYTHFDTKAICAPTRASLLTGRNCQTIRMGDLPSNLSAPDPQDVSSIKGEIPSNVEFLPQALHSAGYNTFAVGKWHLSPVYETGKPGNNASFPLQRGFDYFYGYKMGWTDQYHPLLFEGNNPVPEPYHDGYYLSQDLAEHAINAMKRSQLVAPQKPMFLYLAMPFAHAPLQAPKEYIDRYACTYQKGWDVLRQERFAREKDLGLIPAYTKLPPRENGDPAWDSLTPQQRRVYSRFMAAYAGYIEYGDEQLGKVLAYLKDAGLDDNTLVVLITDNGAASEMKQGGFRRPYFDKTTLAEMDGHLMELGSPSTEPLYQRPWAMAGDTPFRRYKLWPYLGGVRTPMIIRWPGMVPDPGAIRKQWVDVIDIAPTLLGAADTHFDDSINGVQQVPIAGKSFLGTIRNPKESSARDVQFFELRGNRAIASGRWRAVAMHKRGTSFSADQWQLFDIRSDPSESDDLSKKYPAQLQAMQRIWEEEATKYGDLHLVEPPALLAHAYDDAFMD